MVARPSLSVSKCGPVTHLWLSRGVCLADHTVLSADAGSTKQLFPRPRAR